MLEDMHSRGGGCKMLLNARTDWAAADLGQERGKEVSQRWKPALDVLQLPIERFFPLG